MDCLNRAILAAVFKKRYRTWTVWLIGPNGENFYWLVGNKTRQGAVEEACYGASYLHRCRPEAFIVVDVRERKRTRRKDYLRVLMGDEYDGG